MHSRLSVLNIRCLRRVHYLDLLRSRFDQTQTVRLRINLVLPLMFTKPLHKHSLTMVGADYFP